MVFDDHLHSIAKMTGKIHEKNGVSVPPNSHLSYVLRIRFHQPTIRIKIPMVLAKAMKRRNQARGQIDGYGGDNKKKPLAKSRKSFGKKVGSMFSNVFGKKSSMDETDEEMKKLKLMIENIDMGSEKITVKINEENNLNDGVQQMAVATGFGMSENGEKAKPIVNERPKSRRTTYSKNISRRIEVELNKGKVHNVDSAVAGTKGIAENFRYKTVTSRRTFRTSLSMKMMAGEKQLELCKKKILMGIRCRPLSHSGKLQYDENGFLIPEIIP